MLKSNANRVCTFFAAHYAPTIALGRKLPEAAEFIQSRWDTPHWGISTGKYVFRDTEKRIILIAELRNLVLQTIGLAPWSDHLGDHANLITEVLQKLGVAKLSRIGFLVHAYLPLGMTHAEMVDLMYGSFLAPKNDLTPFCGAAYDALADIYGERDQMKIQLTVAPMTSDQAGKQLMALNNLDAFVEPKLLDPGINEFKDRLATDCLFFSCDLFRTEVGVPEVASFLRRSLDEADSISASVVQFLKSLPNRKGK